MTRTPLRSKRKKAVHSLPVFRADPWTAFSFSKLFTLALNACFVYDSLVVLVIAFVMPFGYTFVAIRRKEKGFESGVVVVSVAGWPATVGRWVVVEAWSKAGNKVGSAPCNPPLIDRWNRTYKWVERYRAREGHIKFGIGDNHLD